MSSTTIACSQGVCSWDVGLNAQQRRVASYESGHLLVIAGAGTGKTRTLAGRVAYLIEAGVLPEDILLLTFTRRAASEMLARAALAVPHGEAASVSGGTFHSIAYRELRTSGRAVGLPGQFTLIDAADAAELFRLLRTEGGFGESGQRFPKAETIADIYSRMLGTQEQLDSVLKQWFPWCIDVRNQLVDLFEAYTARKRDRGLVDFDDLLLYWRELVTSALTSASDNRCRWRFVLVDEAQDINSIEADIVCGLVAGGGQLCAVGDDAQAIFGFRGSAVDHIWALPERLPDVEVIKLEENYRSTPEILAAANAVMDQALGPYPKELWSRRSTGPQPELVTCYDDASQAAYVCDQVLARCEDDGFWLRDQAVLVRTAHHANRLEIELRRRRIPYVVYGGLRFLERAHVRDLVALVRILENPRDELAWQRICCLLPGVGPAHTRDLLGAVTAEMSGASLHQILSDTAWLPIRAHAAWKELADALRDCLAVPEPTLVVQVDRLVKACAAVFANAYQNVAERVGDLEVLTQAASEHTDRNSFLTDLTLDPPARTGALAGPPHLDDDYLVISTIHGAKGLEYRAIYVIHAADGNIPSDMATASPDTIAEEQRLLYVALTRAQDRLTICWPLRYWHHRRAPRRGAHNYAQLSRFLASARSVFNERTVGFEAQAELGAGDVLASGSDTVHAKIRNLWT